MLKKYIEIADKVNTRYGALRYDGENSDNNDRLRLQRGEEHFQLSDKMNKELESMGVDKATRDVIYHKLWTHIVFETNRIDGADEIAKKIMQDYGSTPDASE